MRLSKKHILLTGGSSGIGLALAEAFLKNGAAVAFTHTTDRSLQRSDVRRIICSYPRAVPIMADFRDPFSADELVEQAHAMLGGLSVLVNNAAVFARDSLVATSMQTIHQILNVNLVASHLLISSFARLLAGHKRPGSIINISSLSATVARSRMAAYQYSKAALEMLSTSAAYELAPLGIRSNVIAPGLTETPANALQRIGHSAVWDERVANIPLGRAGVPTDFVGAAVFLASDESNWMTGAKVVIDGGASTY